MRTVLKRRPGAASLGSAWAQSFGQMSREDSFKLLDRFWELGGNLVDTAGGYQGQLHKDTDYRGHMLTSCHPLPTSPILAHCCSSDRIRGTLEGESERIIGDWMQERGNRNEVRLRSALRERQN